jgi:hypothetical protein
MTLTDERSIVRLGRSQRQLHIIDLPYLYVDPLVGRLTPRMGIVFVISVKTCTVITILCAVHIYVLQNLGQSRITK